MPIIKDFRSDFRLGRTGDGARIKQDTQAYLAGIRDANNMMISVKYELERRWGTEIRAQLGSTARLETWNYAEETDFQFLLVFTAGRLQIFDTSGVEIQSFQNELTAWTAETQWFLTTTSERASLLITDQSFQPVILTYTPATGVFDMQGYEFSISEDNTLQAPFFQFEDDELLLTPTIFTTAGTPSFYGTHIAAAGGFPETDFDLAAGTGKIRANRDFFVDDHVGQRMRLLDGEFEVQSVQGPREATIKVWKDIAKRLDTNPFFARKGSTLIETTAFEHKQNVGSQVFCYGLTDDKLLQAMTKYCGLATADATGNDPQDPPAAAYTIKSVSSPDAYEVEVDVAFDVNEATGLYGGSDVFWIPFDGISGVKEAVISKTRGWPQACVYHERRLWLGGTSQLPDAVWGSVFAQPRNIDLGEGNPTDAVQLLGLGEQVVIRHLLSGFNLEIFSDKAEIYVPGSRDIAITQETAAPKSSTYHGASFARPLRFDDATFFGDIYGRHVREYRTADTLTEYTADPASVATTDWILSPRHASRYEGAPQEVMPYLFWSSLEDGSAIVMHSSKRDNALGFMRWSIANASIDSIVGLGARLFATVTTEGQSFLVEFDLDLDRYPMDLAEVITARAAGQMLWQSEFHAGEEVVVYANGEYQQNAVIDEQGNFETDEGYSQVIIGNPVDWFVEFYPAVTALRDGSRIGDIQCIVSTHINWIHCEDALVDTMPAVMPSDRPFLGGGADVDEWREYYVGIWDREPVLKVRNRATGIAGIRGVRLNVKIGR